MVNLVNDNNNDKGLERQMNALGIEAQLLTLSMIPGTSELFLSTNTGVTPKLCQVYPQTNN